MNSGTFFQSGGGGGSTTSPAFAIYQYNTNNNYGSTNLTVFKFSNNSISTDSTSLLTIVNSSTLGLSITANRDCDISIMFSQNLNQAAPFGITKNSTGLSNAINVLAKTEILSFTSTVSANITNSTTVFTKVIAGDILRPQGDTAINGTAPGDAILYIFAEEI